MRTISYEEAKEALEAVAADHPDHCQPFCLNFDYDQQPSCLVAKALATKLLPDEYTYQMARRLNLEASATAGRTASLLYQDGVASFEDKAIQLLIRAQAEADRKKPWGEVVPQVLAEFEGMT